MKPFNASTILLLSALILPIVQGAVHGQKTESRKTNQSGQAQKQGKTQKDLATQQKKKADDQKGKKKKSASGSRGNEQNRKKVQAEQKRK